MSKKDFKITDIDALFKGEETINNDVIEHTEDKQQQQETKPNDKPMSSKQRKQSKNDTIEIETPKKYTTKKTEENRLKRENDPTLTTDEKGNRNRYNNYAITIKIDEDLKEYFTKIEWVKMLTERESTTKNKYINNLVRQDMLKKLNLKESATNEQVQKAWEDFKKANNI